MGSEHVESHTICLDRRVRTARSSSDNVSTHAHSSTAVGGSTGAPVTGPGRGATGPGVAGSAGVGVTGASVSGKMSKGTPVSVGVTMTGAGVSGEKETPKSNGDGVGLLVDINTSSQVIQSPCVHHVYFWGCSGGGD